MKIVPYDIGFVKVSEFINKNDGFSFSSWNILDYKEYDRVDYIEYLVETVNLNGNFTEDGIKIYG